ncbi:hypothetical protein ACGF5O_08230 [Streptomyces sp. NPDC048291]|uniref:hypothetical protein n=1 Tax=Streptomyces sp. NPDC048291 TaxID=3365530 RepID=UPI0037125E8C
MRAWYWFLGTGFIVVAFFCFITALTIWNTARTDQTYQRKPKHVAIQSGMGRAARQPLAARDHLAASGVISASEPSWTAPYTGLSPRQFAELITALRREGTDPGACRDRVITTAANVNDVTQALALVDAIPPVTDRPDRPRHRPDSLLGDKRVEQTLALLDQFKRLAVRWEHRTELRNAYASLA